MTGRTFQRDHDIKLRHYVAEHEKDTDTFVLCLTYPPHLKVHRTTNIPLFSVEITRLPPEPTAILRPMPPNVSEIDSPDAYRLPVLHRAAALRKTADTISKKSQA